MAKDLTKILVFYLCMNIILYIGGVNVINDNEEIMGFFIDTEATDTNIVISDELDGLIPIAPEQKGTGFLEFVDSLGGVKNIITFMVNIMFTPLGLFTGAGLPTEIVLSFGVPLMVVLFMGVAYFFRSGS